MSTTPTWLITGASSGLGHDLASHVLNEGHEVVLAARNEQSMQQLAAQYPESALVVGVDVTNPEQRKSLISRAEQRFGKIDFLVNNAGIDYLGAIEEQREEDYRQVFEVNFFAAVELLRLALPGMRARRSGMIVNMSSMDGIASLPGNAFYSASKFALEGLTESLWQEIEPVGLKAVLVEPGSFLTGIDARTHFSGELIPDYDDSSGNFFRAMQNVEMLRDVIFPGDPKRAAEVLFEQLTSHPTMHRIILGSDAMRRIQTKMDDLQADFDASRLFAAKTDFAKAS
ncbi:SDR family NAD(P)-dependent oxidoreductase [Leifsonia flava]|uniref:SDR family NAD(P)-dependent oxidoreductase n=1 Tax=Orlajensenia leifsoniae TaxID=2561933 RepID=A0A4Y9R8R8_9MICO|nr:SDR family NAD(P)-dependent oxidoreductase [Leifsonia flava]TFW00183.1 SDR family NAD(P)-dependent oxidoreductase [Leifsonia flava]